jgi:hypothetical protein
LQRGQRLSVAQVGGVGAEQPALRLRLLDLVEQAAAPLPQARSAAAYEIKRSYKISRRRVRSP